MTLRMISNKSANFVRGDSAKSSGAKFKASIFAILIGLVVGMIPILAVGGNPFVVYWDMFTQPLSGDNINKTIVVISIFILMGAGIGVSFRTGLFNIGASGQFLLAGVVSVMISIKFGLDNGAAIPLLMFVSMLVGAFAAGVAGALKAFFNVHEVVSTILLNWMIFYFSKYLMKKDTFQAVGSENSLMVDYNSTFSIGEGSFDPLIIFFIVIIVVIGIAAIFKFTSFGFRLKINGLSETAATYSGISTKMNTIYSMMISGALCGLAGYFFYIVIVGQIPALGSDLPSYGFEAITVTLLSFSSPIGAIPAGFLYGTMTQGGQFAGYLNEIPKESVDLVLGIIIFLTAIAPVLVKVKPIEKCRNLLLLNTSPIIKNNKDILNTNVTTTISKYDSLISEAKNKQDEQKLEYEKRINALMVEVKKIKESGISKDEISEKITLLKNKFKQETFDAGIAPLNKLHSELNSELKFIKMQFRKKQIDIFRRDILITDTTNRYKDLITKHKLNEVNDLITSKKQAIKSLKNEHKVFSSTNLNRYFGSIEEVRKDSSDKIDVLSNKLSTDIREVNLKLRALSSQMKTNMTNNKNNSLELEKVKQEYAVEKDKLSNLKNEFNEKFEKECEVLVQKRKSDILTIKNKWKVGA